MVDHNLEDYGDTDLKQCSMCEKLFEAGVNVEFALGEDGSATHKDTTTAINSYTETVNGYTLTLNSPAKVYKDCLDAKGNGSLKLGSSSAAGSFSFTVPDEITKVIIHVAGYKDNTAKVKVNGGETQTISTLSDNGEYTAIEVDTSVNKTVSFTTVSGGYRAMINSIVFSKEGGVHTNTEEIDDAVAATCTEPGKTAGSHCPVCGTVLVAQEVVPAGHAWNDATCTAPKTCSVCEATEGEALGHDYEEEITTAATCTEDGVKTYTCVRGDHTYTEPIGALGHVDENKDNLCDRVGCGVTMVVCNHTVNEDGMNLKEAVEPTCAKDGKLAYYTCDYCKDVYAYIGGEWTKITEDSQLVVPATGEHNYEGVVTTEPTCTAKGEKTYTCTVCEDAYTEELDMAPHAEEIIEAKAPTCNATGLTAGVKCSVCGAVTVAPTEIPATGVHADEDSDNRCDSCGEILGEVTASVVIASYADEKGWVNGTKYPTIELDSNATATANGSSNTGKYYTTGESWRTYASESATITISVADGYELVSITVTYSEGAFTNLTSGAAANASGSSVTYSCTTNARITAISVTYKKSCAHANKTVIDAVVGDCKTEGFTEGEKCADCGEITVAPTSTGFGGHNYGEYVVKVPATCAAEGSEVATCTICGNEKTQSIPVSEEHTTNLWDSDEEGHWNVCACGEVADTAGKAAHADGDSDNFCDICGKATVACNHIVGGQGMTHTAAVEATCTTTGNVEYYTCSYCSTKFVVEDDALTKIESEVVAALDHAYTDAKLQDNKDGTHSMVCTREGCGNVDSVKTEHTYTDGVCACSAKKPVTKKYVKVTSAPSDWSGTYLIVYEDGNVAFNGGLDSFDAVGNTISVTITDNAIVSNDETNAAAFTIASTTGGYSIQGASEKYIGYASSSSNGLTTSDSALQNTISINADGEVDIIGAGGAYLRYNAANNQTRFRYYKSSSYASQKAITLYKLED